MGGSKVQIRESKEKNRNFPLVLIILIGIAGALSLVSHVTASLILTNTSFLPAPPLVPGQQKVSVTVVIIPSGAMTFSRTHEIQMQTDLEDARWNIQVMINGIPAARQTAVGSAAFVNGALISYPTNYDVSVVVALDGTVPASAGPEIGLMKAEEIDNSGEVVPGSVVTISRMVAVLTVQVTETSTTPATTIPSPPPTEMPGFSILAGIGALVPGCLAAGGRIHGKNCHSSEN